MRKIAILWVMAAGTLLFAADSQVSERGQQEEQHSCVQCHSLRLVNAQRLSRAAWGKEIDKMMGWGAPVRDRNLLLDYLSEQYPDSKPVPKPELTRNGVASGSKH